MDENWQSRASQFAKEHNLHHAPGVYALDLMSELGEVAKEILLATDYGKRPYPDSTNEALASELGDALYSLCQLATSASINLEDAFTETMQKYQNRWQEKGHMGSQNESPDHETYKAGDVNEQ